MPSLSRLFRAAIALTLLLALQGCKLDGGGGSSSSGGGAAAIGGEALTASDVQQILAQAIQEAVARGQAATIAVVDRVGNVLAVFRMDGALTGITITSNRGVTTGLEGVVVSDTLAVIAKAVTGAYLSSRGNAFTTRTAGQIIQEHFNPGEFGQPGGPLFGVQFSQLPCSDMSVRFVSGSPQAFIGPKRSPLGLSADPGGLPLYKNGDLVGGIGVISDGVYGLDLNITNFDADVDELIAIAGTVGYAAPVGIRANHITVEGKSLRFTDLDSGSLLSTPSSAPIFVDGVNGDLVAVIGYFDGAVVAGKVFGEAGSGIRQDTSGVFGVNAFVLVDGLDAPRFPPIAGTFGGADALTANEVTVILSNALQVAIRARAQIRRPLNSHAEVTVSVVDGNGRVLGIARTADAPIFGTDVSLQKARTAAFFSNTLAASELAAAGTNVLGTAISDYVTAVQAFVGPSALSDGIAFSDRAGGNLSRPFYPDGVDANANGPFSRPFASWSPFSTGLQLDLVVDNLVTHLGFVGGSGTDTAARCSNLPLVLSTGSNRIANGIQIFPGSAPIYRSGTLIGGIGVSGDGVDQDDLVAFLGLNNAGIEVNVGNAPQSIRADTLTPKGVRLRYINCPFAPFLDDPTNQNVCAGL
ncbi:MAG: heme-binding protein [Kiloniellaceae bacterium]